MQLDRCENRNGKVGTLVYQLLHWSIKFIPGDESEKVIFRLITWFIRWNEQLQDETGLDTIMILTDNQQHQ